MLLAEYNKFSQLTLNSKYFCNVVLGDPLGYVTYCMVNDSHNHKSFMVLPLKFCVTDWYQEQKKHDQDISTKNSCSCIRVYTSATNTKTFWVNLNLRNDVF